MYLTGLQSDRLAYLPAHNDYPASILTLTDEFNRSSDEVQVCTYGESLSPICSIPFELLQI
jgi:hypothetical protein